eukprot:CAMPEP_0197516528 /NCGR_PEP_ID=MMETSP1318-20131121/1412_1 /TAXON_ID=552666 /ORGANISM="Partenskyella glossopodia, Strain RCC365" /LENGTH=595 /DNA_ID=CAMNT_0043065343 /DNA_START=40 /DNA_END=1827 /DNA_ORIENTATION=-
MKFSMRLSLTAVAACLLVMIGDAATVVERSSSLENEEHEYQLRALESLNTNVSASVSGAPRHHRAKKGHKKRAPQCPGDKEIRVLIIRHGESINNIASSSHDIIRHGKDRRAKAHLMPGPSRGYQLQDPAISRRAEVLAANVKHALFGREGNTDPNKDDPCHIFKGECPVTQAWISPLRRTIQTAFIIWGEKLREHKATVSLHAKPYIHEQVKSWSDRAYCGQNYEQFPTLAAKEHHLYEDDKFYTEQWYVPLERQLFNDLPRGWCLPMEQNAAKYNYRSETETVLELCRRIQEVEKDLVRAQKAGVKAVVMTAHSAVMRAMFGKFFNGRGPDNFAVVEAIYDTHTRAFHGPTLLNPASDDANFHFPQFKKDPLPNGQQYKAMLCPHQNDDPKKYGYDIGEFYKYPMDSTSGNKVLRRFKVINVAKGSNELHLVYFTSDEHKVKNEKEMKVTDNTKIEVETVQNSETQSYDKWKLAEAAFKNIHDLADAMEECNELLHEEHEITKIIIKEGTTVKARFEAFVSENSPVEHYGGHSALKRLLVAFSAARIKFNFGAAKVSKQSTARNYDHYFDGDDPFDFLDREEEDDNQIQTNKK